MSFSISNPNYKILLGNRKIKKVRIKKIRKESKKIIVYNLRVESPYENFFANKILVHNCSLGCTYCVTAKTKILMANGEEKVIAKISEKESVITFNEKTKEYESSEVVATMNREADEIIALEIEDGIILEITPEHPVFVKEKGWIAAGNLIENDEVILWKQNYEEKKNT